MSVHTCATPERHVYDSFPEPKPFWIATCRADGCNISLNSGHHYTDRDLAVAACHRHNVAEHPLRAFCDVFSGWWVWTEGEDSFTRYETHDNSATIRYREDVILSLAAFEPRRDGLATALLSLHLDGHPGVRWRITEPISPEAQAFWDHARQVFPTQRFAVAN